MMIRLVYWVIHLLGPDRFYIGILVWVWVPDYCYEV